MFADNARANFFRPGGDHLTLLNVYNEVYANGKWALFRPSLCLSTPPFICSGSRVTIQLSGALTTSFNTGADIVHCVHC